MKLKTPYKTVMFYGNILRINARANWLAVNEDGTMTAFMEEPHGSYGSWDVKSGAIWNLDARMELEGKDWKDTLTHCPRDQQWMIEAVAKLDQAWDLHTDGLLPREAKEHVLNRLVDILLYRAEGRDTLQATWDSWMEHAVPGHLHDENITNGLYDLLFPKPKEPEYRVVKDYYGADVIVPGWAEWIAINRKGSVMAFDMRPGISPGYFWEYGIQDKQGQVTQVAWRDGTTSKENWRDSLREVQP